MNRYGIKLDIADHTGATYALRLAVTAGSCVTAMAHAREKVRELGLQVDTVTWELLGPAPPPIGTFYERKLTDKARVFVNTVGGPDAGGAHVTYHLFGNSKDRESFCKAIVFQCGNPDEGINGITNEQLLAIVRHRLQGFQSGPFPCEENAEAGKHVDAALEALERRADERLARGVAGREEL